MKAIMQATALALLFIAGVTGCRVAGPSPTPLPAVTPSATVTPTPASTTVAMPGFKIYFMDVEQGDATLIIAGTGEALLVDGGRSEVLIRDRLQRLGIRDLDSIAATHPDADHIAGLVEVLKLYQVEHIYLNGGQSDTRTFDNLRDAVGREKAGVATLSRGSQVPLGNLSIKVLHPEKLTGDSNVDSMVLLLNCGVVDVLLMGDAEVESEQDMLAAGTLSDVDVLKVGHHGSRTSTSQPFLDLVKPEVAIISAGRFNPYGHPHQAVVDRLNKAGVSIVSTDTTAEDNTLTLTSDCRAYELSNGSDIMLGNP